SDTHLRQSILLLSISIDPPPPTSTLFPYTTLFRSAPVLEPRLAGGAQASERSAQCGAGDPRGAGDAGPDPGPDAGAEDRKPAKLLGPADGARRAAGSDEGVRARTAVAAREPDLPLPGRRRVRTLVRPRVPREATLRRPHADLHRADPAPRAVRGRGSSRRAGVRVAGFRPGALRGRAGRVRDPPVVGATPGRRQRRRLVRDGLGWRPLPGARAEEGEPRWGGGGRRARVVHAVG